MTYSGASLGAGVSGATLNINTNQIGSGRVGMMLSLPSGTSCQAGTQEVLRVTFAVSPAAPGISTPLTFGNVPILEDVSDVNAEDLATTYTDGSISIGAGYEADVMPLPNGDGRVTVTDWVKVGRYAAGLDPIPSGAQFQRADCAPKSTLGNGVINVSDWVQAGRYAAGLDPLTKAGGPTGPSGNLVMAARVSVNQFLNSLATDKTDANEGQNRIVQVTNSTIYPGQTNAIPVQLVSQGDESALSFSLVFDTALFSYAGATVGSGAPGAALNLNTNQLGLGMLGLALCLPTGNTFVAGTQQVANVKLVLAAGASGSTTVALGDQPVLREISDVFGNELPATYTNGLLTVYVAAPKLLQLYPLGLLPGGYFHLEATNADGSGIDSQRVSNIELRATTNLGLNFTNWLTLTNAPVLSNGVLYWNDFSSTNSSQRFYKTLETQ